MSLLPHFPKTGLTLPPSKLAALPWTPAQLRGLLCGPERLSGLTSPLRVTLTDFTDEGLRTALGLPPLRLVLSGDLGGQTSYRLPLMPVPLLNTAMPYAILPAPTSTLLYLLYQVNPAVRGAAELSDVRPGGPIPLAPTVQWRTFHWDASAPKLPTALMRAVTQGTVVSFQLTAHAEGNVP